MGSLTSNQAHKRHTLIFAISFLLPDRTFTTCQQPALLAVLCWQVIFQDLSQNEDSFRRRGKMARGGSPGHLCPPNYLDNLPVILKIYEFGLRFKERPAGTLQ